MRLFRRLYDWMLAKSASPKAEPILAAVSFCCSIFFPIPQDAMLVPMCLAQPRRALRYAAVATAGSVAGGVVAYFFGAFLYKEVAQPILQLYQAETADEIFKNYYNRYGFLFVLAGGMTPLPYKVIALLSGYTGLFLPLFILASLGGRIVRFFSIAILIKIYGDPIKNLINRYFTQASWLLFALIVGGFIIIYYVL